MCGAPNMWGGAPVSRNRACSLNMACSTCGTCQNTAHACDSRLIQVKKLSGPASPLDPKRGDGRDEERGEAGGEWIEEWGGEGGERFLSP